MKTRVGDGCGLLNPIYIGQAIGAGGGGSPGATLFLELDAAQDTFTLDDFITPATANNDPVGGWSDQVSGIEAIADDAGDFRPLLKTNIFDNQPAVLFNGSSQYMVIEPFLDVGPAVSFSYVAVVKFQGGGSGRQHWLSPYIEAGESQASLSDMDAVAGNPGYGNDTAEGGALDTNTHIVFATYDAAAGELKLYIANSLVDTEAYYFFSSSTPTSGVNWSIGVLFFNGTPSTDYGNNYANIYIGYLAVYTGVLTSGQRSSIYSTLETRFT